MAGDSDDMQKAQALVNQLQMMKEEAQGIAQKITELEQERHEHTLVAETLEKLDSERKCFRWAAHAPAAPEADVLCRRLRCVARSAAGCVCAPAAGTHARLGACEPRMCVDESCSGGLLSRPAPVAMFGWKKLPSRFLCVFLTLVCILLRWQNDRWRVDRADGGHCASSRKRQHREAAGMMHRVYDA
jgi:hypothetical protein